MNRHEKLGAVASIPLLNGIRPPYVRGGRFEFKCDKLIDRHFTSEEVKEEKLEDGLVPTDVATSGCCLFRRKNFEGASFDSNLIYGIGGIVGFDFWLQLKKGKWKAAWCTKSIVNHRPWLCSIEEYVRRRLFRTREHPKSKEYFMNKYGIQGIVEKGTRESVNSMAKIRTITDLLRETLLTYLPI